MIFERVSQNPFLIKECVSQLRESPEAAQGVGAELALILDPDTAIPLLLAAFPKALSSPSSSSSSLLSLKFTPQFVALYRDHVNADEVSYVGKCCKGMPKHPQIIGSIETEITDVEGICNDFRRVFAANDTTEQQAQRAAVAVIKLLCLSSISQGDEKERNVRTILDTIIFGVSCRSSQPVNESLVAGIVGWSLNTPNSHPWDEFPNLLEPFLRAIICATRNTTSIPIKHYVNHIIQISFNNK